MGNYSKSHERDENRRMNKALVRSLLAFIPIPVLSLALAMGGFFRMCVRVTDTHKVKRVILTLFSTLVMIAVLALHVGAVYHYCKDPTILGKGVRVAWKALTGQDNPPWMAQESGGDYYDYSYSNDPYADDTYSTDGSIDESNGDASVSDYDPTQDPEYDADFDESELNGFVEDEATQAPDESNLSGTGEKDLFDQMMSEKKNGVGSLLP